MDTETCAWCPRLCRHVCPVTVATGREAATPTAIMTILTFGDPALARAAASLCLGCGACTAHCKLHMPVSEMLAALKPPPTSAPAPVAAMGEITFTPCWTGPAPGPDQLACCGVRDGFPEREPDAARQVAEENVRRFAGRTVACPDSNCASWLGRHGARIGGV